MRTVFRSVNTEQRHEGQSQTGRTNGSREIGGRGRSGNSGLRRRCSRDDPGVARSEQISRSANLARLSTRREARKIQHLFGITVMGWRSQENYELTNERDFNRLPWRDRKIIQKAGGLQRQRSCSPASWPVISGDRAIADGVDDPCQAVECTSANTGSG